MVKKVLVLFLLMSCASYAAEITVRWDMPTENLDGTPLTDLGGAKIYWGTTSSNYTYVADAGLTNRYTITNLQDGVTYYVNGTAYSVHGLESAFTTEVAKRASIAPNQPVILYLKKDH